MRGLKLSEDVVNEIKQLREESIQYYKDGNKEQEIKKMIEAWDKIPYPKSVYSESYLIVQEIIEIYIEHQEYEKGNMWVDLMFICNLKRLDDGEREFTAGVLAYEQGNFEKAKELFFVSSIKSEGVIFNGKDKKYLDLIK